MDYDNNEMSGMTGDTTSGRKGMDNDRYSEMRGKDLYRQERGGYGSHGRSGDMSYRGADQHWDDQGYGRGYGSTGGYGNSMGSTSYGGGYNPDRGRNYDEHNYERGGYDDYRGSQRGYGSDRNYGNDRSYENNYNEYDWDDHSHGRGNTNRYDYNRNMSGSRGSGGRGYGDPYSQRSNFGGYNEGRGRNDFEYRGGHGGNYGSHSDYGSMGGNDGGRRGSNYGDWTRSRRGYDQGRDYRDSHDSYRGGSEGYGDGSGYGYGMRDDDYRSGRYNESRGYQRGGYDNDERYGSGDSSDDWNARDMRGRNRY